LSPGQGTEVIALFDLDLLAKGRPGVRAVHIFTERRKATPKDAPVEKLTSSSMSSMTAPLLVGAMALLIIIFGIVQLAQRWNAPEVHAEVTVPEGETRDVPLHVGTSDVTLKVERKGANLVITSGGNK
jgi:hypothetical protein